MTFGRDPINEIPLDDPSTSRHHAQIAPDGVGGHVIEDLGSKNGTLVNNLRITSAKLNQGDEILIGSIKVVYLQDPGAITTSLVRLAEQTSETQQASFASRDNRLNLTHQRLEMLYHLSERLTRLRDAAELFNEVMDVCFEMLRFERGAIAVVKPVGRGVDWPVVRNLRGADGELTVSRTILGRALDHGERAIINDTARELADPSVSVVQQGIRSAMCVPLLHEDRVLGVIYGDRVSSSTVYKEEDVDFLAALARQASIGLINSRLMEEQRMKMQIEKEISLAREIQDGLFPTQLTHTEVVQIAASNDPGRRVSGDYYDQWETDDGHIAFLIADVTGEGIAAAMLMANLQAAVRVTMPNQTTLAEHVSRWNDLIYKNTTAAKFITLYVCVLDTDRRMMTLVNAGHPPPIVVPESGEPFPLEAEGSYPLGVVGGVEFQSHTVELSKTRFGLFFHTDGVFEAMNVSQDCFGSQRMLSVLNETRDLAPQDVIKAMHKAIKKHCGAAAQSDDITILAARVQ